jgi:hypothetical protein
MTWGWGHLALLPSKGWSAADFYHPLSIASDLFEQANLRSYGKNANNYTAEVTSKHLKSHFPFLETRTKR